jgi:hypothetical protein
MSSLGIRNTVNPRMPVRMMGTSVFTCSGRQRLKLYQPCRDVLCIYSTSSKAQPHVVQQRVLARAWKVNVSASRGCTGKAAWGAIMYSPHSTASSGTPGRGSAGCSRGSGGR